jgi:hypothetical protein
MQCPNAPRESAIVTLRIAAALVLHFSSSHLFAAAGSKDEATLRAAVSLANGMFER